MKAVRKSKAVLTALATLFAAGVFAENYYWDKNLPQSFDAPLDFNAVSSWRIGGDSEYDPAAQQLPVRGTDTIYFRGATAFVGVYSPTEMPATQVNCQNTHDGEPSKVTFKMANSANLHYGFTEVRPSCELSFVGGQLIVDSGMEMYVNRYCELNFTDTTVSNLSVVCFDTDSDAPVNNHIRFHNVVSDGMKVVLSPYNNRHGFRHNLVIDGDSEMGNFTLSGHYFDSEIVITNGPVFRSFTFDNNGNQPTTCPEGVALTNRFHVEGADLGLVNWPWQSLPERCYEFDAGSRLALNAWDPAAIGGRDSLLRFSGAETWASNVTINVSGPRSRLEILDGAFVESRRFVLGYECGDGRVSGRVAGEGTVWQVQPNDLGSFEAVLVVGKGNQSDNPTRNNSLVVEDGAMLNISTNRSFKGGTLTYNMTGLLIGGEKGDDGNSVIVRNGAVVSNDFWTGIGGTFLSSGGAGGARNLLRVDDATYLGGWAYNDVWDSTLYLGSQFGYSNRFEVVNGGVAKFKGCCETTRFISSGGSVIFVENGLVEIASKISASANFTEAGQVPFTYGNPVIEIGGSNGVFRAGAILLDAGHDGLGWDEVGEGTGFDIRLHVGKGRVAEYGPMLDITGSMYDYKKDVFVGKTTKDTVHVTLDINNKWAHSGKNNEIVLMSIGYGNGDYRFTENGVNAIKEELESSTELGECVLSSETDFDQKVVRLKLRAGEKPGLVLILR